MNLRDIIEGAAEVVASLRHVKRVSGQLDNLLSSGSGSGSAEGSIYEVLFLWTAAGGPRCRTLYDRLLPGQPRSMIIVAHVERDCMPAGTWIVVRGPATIRQAWVDSMMQIDGNGGSLIVTSIPLELGQTCKLLLTGLEV